MFYSEDNATFQEAFRTCIHQITLTFFIKAVLWSIRWSYETIWSSPLMTVKLHSVVWLYTLTPSTDQTTHSTTFLPNLSFYRIMKLSIEHLQRMCYEDRTRPLLQTRGPVHLWTCICSTCWDQSFSKTCYFSRLSNSNISKYFLNFATCRFFCDPVHTANRARRHLSLIKRKRKQIYDCLAPQCRKICKIVCRVPRKWVKSE